MKYMKICGYILFLLGLGTLPVRGQTQTGSFDRTLQVSGPVSLEVASGSGSITVRTGGNRTVHVLAKITAHGSWFGGSAADRIRSLETNPPIEQQGNTIRIGRVTGTLWWLRWVSDNVSIDYDLTVPAETGLVAATGSGDQSIAGLRLPSSARTGSGNITVEDMVGDLQVSSGSGDLKIDSVNGVLNVATGSGRIQATGVAGEVSASTGSGKVEIQQIAAGNATVRTGSGNVNLRGLRGGLTTDTGSGEIHVEGDPEANWHIGTASGDIDLILPAQASVTLDARTVSGRVKVGRPLTVHGPASRNHLQGSLGDGATALDLHTVSGNIEIN